MAPGCVLLDFSFLVEYVSAHDGVVFLQLKLFCVIPLVLGRRIVVAAAGGRYQLYFLTHNQSASQLDAAPAQIGKHGIDAFFVDSAKSFG